MGYRKLQIDGREWKYTVGKAVKIVGPKGFGSRIVAKHTLNGMTDEEYAKRSAQACHEGCCPETAEYASVTPAAVTAFIKGLTK